MSNSWLRVLTALVGIPVVLGITYLGGWPFTGMVVLIALAAQWEVYQMTPEEMGKPFILSGLFLGAMTLLTVPLPALLPVTALGGVLLVATLPFRKSTHTLGALATTTLGVVYPSLFLTGFLALRLRTGGLVDDAEAFALTLAVMVLIWVTDTGAYYAGKTLGKHPLAPTVSPRKTWEGTIGGVLAALAAGVAFKYSLLVFLDWPHVLVLAGICGGLSQLGDLAESALKRAAGVKDSGTLLPGHGGLLDRFDALLVAAPLAYLYLVHVAGLYG